MPNETQLTQLLDDAKAEISALDLCQPTQLAEASGRHAAIVYNTMITDINEQLDEPIGLNQIQMTVARLTLLAGYRKIVSRLQDILGIDKLAELRPTISDDDRVEIKSQVISEIKKECHLWPKSSFWGAAIAVTAIVLAFMGVSLWGIYGKAVDSEKLRIAEQKAEAIISELIALQTTANEIIENKQSTSGEHQEPAIGEQSDVSEAP